MIRAATLVEVFANVRSRNSHSQLILPRRMEVINGRTEHFRSEETNRDNSLRRATREDLIKLLSMFGDNNRSPYMPPGGFGVDGKTLYICVILTAIDKNVISLKDAADLLNLTTFELFGTNHD